MTGGKLTETSEVDLEKCIPSRETIAKIAALSPEPSIIFTGNVMVEEQRSSPPTFTKTVMFPYALIGNADRFLVILTSVDGGEVTVTKNHHDVKGNFTGISFVAEHKGSV